jgi:MFS family permease
MTVGHLTALLGHRAFRQLLVTRLAGQLADGLLQAGLIGVVLFAPERAASPTRIAVGFAVLLLPFTLLAPVAGVLLDRWSRVRVLRWANVARAGLILTTAVATAADASELLIFGSALVALALNRLVLAALGASLPRTTPPELLVTGNALAPTLGTFVTVIGGGIGLSLRGLLDHAGESAPFWAAAGCYLAAAATTVVFARDRLGPEQRAWDRPPLQQAWLDVRTGAEHISNTAPARRGLQVVSAQRLLFGAITVWTIVMIRFLLVGTRSNEHHALTALGSVALAAGVGLVLASLVAPALVNHVGPKTTAVAALSCAGLGCLAPLLSLRLGAILVTWFAMGAGAQLLKISVDTMLQRSAPDDLRGRVFIAYDLVFNLSFVLGVTTVAALSLPALDGALLPTAVAGVFAVAALATQRSSTRQWLA